MNSPASPLFSTIRKAFQGAGWEFREVEGHEVIEAGFEAHHGRITLHAQAFPQVLGISVVSESDLEAPDPVYRERVAELILRANTQLTVGNFEMDWDRGRVMFRVTNVFSTEKGDPEIVAALVRTVIAEMDRMTPPLSLLLKTPLGQLPSLNIPALLNREDLLPATGGADEI